MGWGPWEQDEGSSEGGKASLTPSMLSTARQGGQAAGRDWKEGTRGCWGVFGCCGCPQASRTSAWTGAKPSGGQGSPQPALSASPSHHCGTGLCAHPGAWDCGWALSCSKIFPSRDVRVCDHGREWEPGPHSPQQAVI